MQPARRGSFPKPASAYKRWGDISRIHHRHGLLKLDPHHLAQYVRALNNNAKPSTASTPFWFAGRNRCGTRSISSGYLTASASALLSTITPRASVSRGARYSKCSIIRVFARLNGLSDSAASQQQ